MQENELHKFLTVYETMSFAMNLKVGRRLSVEARSLKVRETPFNEQAHIICIILILD